MFHCSQHTPKSNNNNQKSRIEIHFLVQIIYAVGYLQMKPPFHVPFKFIVCTTKKCVFSICRYIFRKFFNAVFSKKRKTAEKIENVGVQQGFGHLLCYIVMNCCENSKFKKKSTSQRYCIEVLFVITKNIFFHVAMMKEKPLRSFSTIRRQTKHNFTTFRYNDDILILGTLK